MPLKYVLMPVLGGIIGYITNDIAIKMLFRPRKAIYIGKWRLPFTPGLIPQQKDRIAHSIGNVVSAQLLNAETLQASVLSKESLSMLRSKITKFIDGFSDNEDTVERFITRYIDQDTFGDTAQAIKTNLERLIIQKMIEANIGAIIIARGMQLIKERLRAGLQTALLNKEFMGQIETMVASAINDMVASVAPSIVHTEVQKISEKILDKRLCDLYKEHQEQIPQLVDQVIGIYEKTLEENMGKLVQAVDIGEIVYKKVAAFSAAELENLIFGIMKRELRAIVYLGALLGFLLGFVNLLF